MALLPVLSLPGMTGTLDPPVMSFCRAASMCIVLCRGCAVCCCGAGAIEGTGAGVGGAGACIEAKTHVFLTTGIMSQIEVGLLIVLSMHQRNMILRVKVQQKLCALVKTSGYLRPGGGVERNGCPHCACRVKINWNDLSFECTPVQCKQLCIARQASWPYHP